MIPVPVVLSLGFLAAPAAGTAAKTVTLQVEASTWRKGHPPFDVGAALTRKLGQAGVATIKTGATDGALEVHYEEAQGSGYSEVGSGGGPTRFGTDITFSLKLVVGTASLLSLHTEASPSNMVRGDVYAESLSSFQRSDSFGLSGELVAAALGIPAALPKVLPMLCGDESKPALALLKRMDFKPSSPKEDAYLAIGEGKLNRLPALGRPAAEALLDCVTRTHPDGYSVDEDAVRIFAQLGDPRATPYMLEELRTNPFFNMASLPGMQPDDSDVPEEVLLLTSALGAAGDRRALGELDSLAARKKRFPSLAGVARTAAARIRARTK